MAVASSGTDQGKTFGNAFKCIKPKLPRAETAVFSINKKHTKDMFWHHNHLKFMEFQKDEDRPDEETGYKVAYLGDSGSPYWVQSKDNKGNKRFTVLAINNGLTNDLFRNNPAEVIKDEYYQCRQIATKLTEEIVKWVKVKSGI